jgi:hypothetical protein
MTTQNGNFVLFFDGRERASGELPSPMSSSFGTMDSEGDQVLMFGHDFTGAERMRVTFCDGRSVELRPLNSGKLRYFGVEFDGKLGTPVTQGLVKGKALGQLFDGQCPPPTTTSKTAPASSPGIALAPTGPADCTGVQQLGDEVLLAVTVNAGHTICVTRQGDTTTTFLDGQQGGSSFTSPATPGLVSTSFGGIGTDQGRLVYFGNLYDNLDGLRLTFCDGRVLTLRALSSTVPRYVAAIIDTSHGMPSTQMLDGDEPAGPHQYTCPPTTTRASGSHKSR